MSASTIGEGDAGAITINASGTILADGESSDGSNSGIFSQVIGDAVGNSGGINITTTDLSLAQEGTVAASTFGEGDAGAITINASGSILADGESPNGSNSGIFSEVTVIAVGNSGGINITTTDLSLIQGGQVSASTFGEGNAGGITINASGTISADGESLDGFNNSGIFSQVAESGEGDAGGVSIDTNNLSLTNEAIISVESLGQGNAGNLLIQTNSIDLENGASLLASTSLGTGGNITLEIDDSLTLRNNSTISAQAFENANGGNVTIDADLIIAPLNQNNDIIASAEQGEGGNININAEGVFGLEERSSTPDNETNDIDASSEFGLDGTVLINTPDVDVRQETIEAPEIVQTETLSTNACSGIAGTSASSFEIVGKGGIPPKPTEPLTSDAIIIDGKSVTSQTENEEERKFVTVIEREEPLKIDEIVPARGIIIKENGDVILTAYPTPNTTGRTPNQLANCHG